MLASVAVFYDAAGPITPPHYGRREEVLRKMLTVVVSAVMMAAMMAISGVALAQGADVCVSNKGETKVQKGASSCSSDSTSHAVAHKDSSATATDNSKADGSIARRTHSRCARPRGAAKSALTKCVFSWKTSLCRNGTWDQGLAPIGV
jgi:hypothetical protein